MLKGSLQTVALPEVLNFLADTGKSGKFHVSGSHGEGALWFDQGRISGIEVTRAHEPSEAIFELLRIEDGEFDFASDADRPEDVHAVDGESGAVAPALEAAQAKMAEWRDIVAVVPSLSHRLELRGEAPAQPVVLEPEQWMMVVAIGAGHSVAEVIDAREMQEFDGCKAVRNLVEASLVEVTEPAADEAVAEDIVVADAVAEDAVADEPVADEAVAEDTVVDAEPSVPEAFGVEEQPVEQPVAVDEPALEDAAEPVLQEPDPAAAVETNGYEAEPAGLARFSFLAGAISAHDATPTESSEADHYAALRAAMVEIGDDLTTDGPEPTYDEPAHQVYEFHADPEMDGRAALQALLSEVADDSPADGAANVESVDGLADRGPWTEHELSAMDGEAWGETSDEASNIVPFAPVHSADEQPIAESDGVTSDAEQADEAEPEEHTPAEEPINRGLLLKFLSSVRN